MMISADEARALAKEKNTIELTRFLKAVEEKIIVAINNGYHICFMDVEGYNYFSISYAPEVLQGLGYQASFDTDYIEQTTYLKVEW